ncbi:MAG: S-layer homology domain-containing protein [Allisonella histaminiformans]|uniref:S-layer homology domain-containing protein n=1 Tax=Allisonella histaminiformans TaxID=209880 RepID=UPI002A7F8FFD|nr:S-layer homology domain-containing protein [Allisonella histaminiformans]MDY3956904.1 S-layer homology domain-containing protein [Allisonella histaminiformans]
MKKILAIAAVAALTAGVSAYAANPFSDVSTSDWAYQAVSQLSDQGIVEGYPDGTFRGQRNITRYELAQIIARLMANEDQFNAEQRATIDKLAGEYADELDNLGVRVSNLEAKVGNISWSGDARMKWDEGYKADGSTEDNFNGRMRINAHAQVNDSTYVDGLLRTDMDFKDNGESNDTYMQRLYVHHDFGSHVGVNVGKYAEFFGQTGMFYDSDLKGAELTYTANDAFSLTAGYGRFSDWDNKWNSNLGDQKNTEYGYAQINGAAGRFAYSLDYIKGADQSKVEVYGGGLTIGLTDKFDVFGDYFKNSDAQGDPDAWTAGLGYGHQDDARVGSFRVSVARVDAEKNAVLGGYTYDVSALDALKDTGVTGVKFWNAAADVTVAKNVRLHGEYDWNVDAKGVSTDYDDLATVSLNYVF